MPAKKTQKTNDELKNTQDMKTASGLVETLVASVPEPAKKQRGGNKKQPVVPEVVATPVPEVVATPVSEPVSEPVGKKKRGGKAQPTEVSASVSSDVKSKTGGKPRTRKSKVDVASAPNETTPPKRQRKSKKTLDTTDTVASSNVSTTNATVAPSDVTEAHDVADDEKHVRSFKVRLPGSETFEGRFTGLTPYQAANKALSKYFRAGDKTHGEVTFSICESTRKSKKSVYTYVGQRHRLADPVKYKIQDGREIVKNFKNSLKKVKKTDNSDMTQALSAPSASA
jgi:hypothetical protein